MISTLSPAGGPARRAEAAIATAPNNALDTPTGPATDTGAGRISTANNRPLYRLSPDQLFTRLDRDAKGYLAASDFVRISPAGARAADAAHGKQNERAQQVFERIDVDGDGQVSQTEFRSAIEAFIAPHGHGKALGIAKRASVPAPPPPAAAPTAPPAPTAPAATAAVQAYASVAAAV